MQVHARANFGSAEVQGRNDNRCRVRTTHHQNTQRSIVGFGRGEQFRSFNVIFLTHCQEPFQLGGKGFLILELLRQRPIERASSRQTKCRALRVGVISHQIDAATVDPAVIAIGESLLNGCPIQGQRSDQIP